MSTRNEADEIQYVRLKVTSGLLLHIGDGIYNSVSGALKELVSNSFDADARTVLISTDYPNFRHITVRDDGIGMSASRLRQAMQTIGSSLKGTIDERRISKELSRPIIGHLGIGLMALSQVCSKARIESQEPGSEKKIVAELDFSDFKKRERNQVQFAKLEVLKNIYGGKGAIKEKLDSEELSVDERAELEEAYQLAAEADKVFQESGATESEGEHLGYCLIYPDLPAVKGERGTTITLSEISQEVRNSLRDFGRTNDTLPGTAIETEDPWAYFREEVNSWTWSDLVERLNRKTNGLRFESLPKYHQFLWELALMSPTGYLDSGPIKGHPDILADKKNELKSYDFSLVVDNRKLQKPILLPSGTLSDSDQIKKEGLDYFLKTINHDDIIDHDELKFSGYLFWQRNQHEPSALRGIKIYIRNVGIGLYDETLMSFRNVNPTSRAGQISGEIYVDEGLERALSVDRNSFKETDAHYFSLQQHLWRLLGSTKQGDGLLGYSVSSYYERKEVKDENRNKVHLQTVRKTVNEVTDGKVNLSVSSSESTQPYKVTKNKITLYKDSTQWPKARDDKYLAQRVLIAVRAAVEAGATTNDLIELLEQILLDK